MDIRKVSTFADFFVICSAASTRRTSAIKEGIEEELDSRGCRVWHAEGGQPGTWIILDYGEVIVHIFHEPLRKFYDLDRLWGDADLINF